MPRKNYAQPDNLQKYLNWLKALKNASSTHWIVCQTKRDRDGLRMLGVRNVYYPLDPFVDFVDILSSANKPIILLYNTDRRSNQKYERLRGLLQQRKVKVNPRFRKILFVQKNRTVRGIINEIHRLAGSDRVHKGLSV